MKNIKKIKKCQAENETLLEKTTKKKLKLEVFEKYMKQITISRSKENKIKTCGDFLLFLTDESRSKQSLAGGSFCGDRLCPICSWRLARRTAFEVLELLAYAREKENKEFLFITLTAKNVKAERLKEEITSFNKAFKRLFETQDFKAISDGFIRKLEITYNEARDDYHPHFHVIVAVKKSYFTSRYYLSRKKLLEMWRRAKRDDTITQVDVRKLKMESVKEVYEIATYATKHKDLYSDKRVFKVFYEAFKNRQVLTFNGLFKELRKLQKEKKLKVDDVLELSNMRRRMDTELMYEWRKRNYELYSERKLTESEFRLIYDIELEFE